MNSEEVTIISIAGKQNAGKTTLIRTLIPELKERVHRVRTLSDEEKKTCKDYGVCVKKKLYGKEHMGIARTTFIIGKDGKVEKIYKKVKPTVHCEEILEFLSGSA